MSDITRMFMNRIYRHRQNRRLRDYVSVTDAYGRDQSLGFGVQDTITYENYRIVHYEDDLIISASALLPKLEILNERYKPIFNELSNQVISRPPKCDIVHLYSRAEFKAIDVNAYFRDCVDANLYNFEFALMAAAAMRKMTVQYLLECLELLNKTKTPVNAIPHTISSTLFYRMEHALFRKSMLRDPQGIEYTDSIIRHVEFHLPFPGPKHAAERFCICDPSYDRQISQFNQLEIIAAIYAAHAHDVTGRCEFCGNDNVQVRPCHPTGNAFYMQPASDAWRESVNLCRNCAYIYYRKMVQRENLFEPIPDRDNLDDYIYRDEEKPYEDETPRIEYLKTYWEGYMEGVAETGSAFQKPPEFSEPEYMDFTKPDLSAFFRYDNNGLRKYKITTPAYIELLNEIDSLNKTYRRMTYGLQRYVTLGDIRFFKTATFHADGFLAKYAKEHPEEIRENALAVIQNRRYAENYWNEFRAIMAKDRIESAPDAPDFLKLLERRFMNLITDCDYVIRYRLGRKKFAQTCPIEIMAELSGNDGILPKLPDEIKDKKHTFSRKEEDLPRMPAFRT